MWTAPYSPTWTRGAHAPRSPGDTAAGPAVYTQSRSVRPHPPGNKTFSPTFPCLCSLSQHPLIHVCPPSFQIQLLFP